MFVSYTTREEEVRAVKPAVDHFLEHVLRPRIEETLGEPPVFYDGYYLRHGSRPVTGDELASKLRFAVEESEVLLPLVSPHYLTSYWCQFERLAMREKKLRPWFDLCRRPPSEDLADNRTLRPTWWQCLLARFLMTLWRLTLPENRPGDSQIGILWKGRQPSLLEMALGHPVHDWRPCVGLASDQIILEPYFPGEMSDCADALLATAADVIEELQRRRHVYRRWRPLIVV